jgi:acylglycerol lipase
MITTCTQHPWNAPDGSAFIYSRWEARVAAGETPRAVMLAVHGLSGAALDYEPLGSHLAALGITTLALELRGQGNDPEASRRGDLETLEDWFADLRALFALVRRLYPGVPVYAYGESMGAALLTRFLALEKRTEQPEGLILASPVVALPGKPNWWQVVVFRFFLWVRPSHRIDVRKLAKGGEEPKLVTRDEAHRKWFETASHKLDCYTIRFFKCLLDLIEGCFAAAPKLKLPVLVIYPAHDVFIAPAKVEAFFALLGSSDKELRFFPDAYHLLLHDHDWPLALEAIEGWLLGRIEGISSLKEGR